MNFFDLSFDELTTLCVSLGGKKFNARQIYEWVYKKYITDWAQMSNLSKTTVKIYQDKIKFNHLKIVDIFVDKKDDTTKFLFELDDHHHIETVLMHFDWGHSVCISTEVGCLMGCKFCASGQLKLQRKLTAGEIVLQFFQINEYLIKKHLPTITNIVVMGIGEPFDNYDNVAKALKILNHPYGINIGSRHITVSTCGLINKFKQFSRDFPQVNLAISLHAPNDQIRNQLMPINQTYSIEQLLKAVDEHIKLTNRRVSFEYIMLKDINDTDECLNQLIKIAKNRLCYVNLIEYNPIKNSQFQPSNRCSFFKNELMKNNIMTTIRLKRGTNIKAACGQLRASYEKANH